MTQHISDTGRLEQELSELQAEIQGSLRTVAQLREVQRRFADLLETYGRMKAFHEEARTEFSRLQEGAERLFSELAERDRTQGENFAQLATANDERWGEYQEKFLEVHKQFGAAQQNLRTELGTQQRELEGSVEERLEDYARRLEEALTRSEARAQELAESVERKVGELGTRLQNFGNYAEGLGRKQSALAEDIARTERRAGRRAGGALALGALNLLLTIALAGGLFYLLFLGGETQLRTLLGI